MKSFVDLMIFVEITKMKSTCISDGISNFTKEEQPEKALSPIEETEEGIIRSFNEEHLWKAKKPIDVIDVGMFTFPKDEHS